MGSDPSPPHEIVTAVTTSTQDNPNICRRRVIWLSFVNPRYASPCLRRTIAAGRMPSLKRRGVYGWRMILVKPPYRDLCTRPLSQRRLRREVVVAGSELVFPVRRLAPA